jgi:hypothetical protein
VNLGMPVSKGKPTSPVVVRRRHVDAGPGVRIEKARVIDAVGMLVSET